MTRSNQDGIQQKVTCSHLVYSEFSGKAYCVLVEEHEAVVSKDIIHVIEGHCKIVAGVYGIAGSNQVEWSSNILRSRLVDVPYLETSHLSECTSKHGEVYMHA